MDFFKQDLVNRAKKIKPIYNEINSLIEMVNENREKLLELQNKLKELENKENCLLEQIVKLSQKQIDENTRLITLKKDFQVILKDFEFESEEEFLKIIQQES